jgi:coenzyme Q-binding protein COQ10
MPGEAGVPHKRTMALAPAARRRSWRSPTHPRRRGGSAPGVAAVRRIRHRWTDLFDLVLDLERYPAFVPHCRAVKVFSRKAAGAGRTVIDSRMSVGLSALEVSYANRTVGDVAARRIEVDALDGPLSRLHVVWAFEPDGEDWTEVTFSVDYAFSSALLAAVASRVFDAMFADILGAFERRADRLFGAAAARAVHSLPFQGRDKQARTSS